MQRICPARGHPSIPVNDRVVSAARCADCLHTIGPHWFIGGVTFILIPTVTILTTLLVLAQFGVYAALLWFSFPIGALGCLKARFSSLDVRRSGPRP